MCHDDWYCNHYHSCTPERWSERDLRCGSCCCEEEEDEEEEAEPLDCDRSRSKKVSILDSLRISCSNCEIGHRLLLLDVEDDGSVEAARGDTAARSMLGVGGVPNKPRSSELLSAATPFGTADASSVSERPRIRSTTMSTNDCTLTERSSR